MLARALYIAKKSIIVQPPPTTKMNLFCHWFFYLGHVAWEQGEFFVIALFFAYK